MVTKRLTTLVILLNGVSHVTIFPFKKEDILLRKLFRGLRESFRRSFMSMPDDVLHQYAYKMTKKLCFLEYHSLKYTTKN